MVVDAGDALFRDRSKPSEMDLARASFVLEGMGDTGVAAMGVGEKDLVPGLAWLTEQAKKAGVPLVAANLVRQDGTAPFQPHVIVETPAGKVGVFGITAAIAGQPYPDGLTAKDPAAAAKEQVAALEKTDLVVALVHGPSTTIREVASIPGIDLVIPSHDGAGGMPYKATPEGASVVATGARGRTLSRISVEPRGEGPLADAGLVDRLAEERGYVEGRLADARARAASATEPKQKEAYGRVVASMQTRLADLDKRIAATGSPQGRRFRADTVSLGEEVPSDKALAAAMHKLEEKYPGISAERAAPGRPPVP